MDSAVNINVVSIVDEYLERGDVATENANCQWTPNGMLMAVGGEGLAKDNLARMCEMGYEELAKKHIEGEVHIHDISLGYPTAYCSGNSLPTLLAEGITSSLSVSKPAKHLRTAIAHIINFVGAMSNEFAGAQAFNDVDVHLAPYAYKAYLDFKKSMGYAMDSDLLENRAMAYAKREVSQSIQEFMYHLNFNSRWGSQCVDVDTECLTLNGWKKHDELEIGEEIYVFDVKTGKLKTDKLLKHTAYEFDGDMIHFKNRVADFLVTPDHRVVRKAFGGSKYHVELAESMLNMKTPPLIPIAAELEREETLQLTDTEIAILAWCLSDSHMEKNQDRITFMQSKKKYYEDIKSLLISYGAEIHEGENNSGLGDGCGYIRIYGDKARKFLKLTGRNREAIPRGVLKKISRRQARIFIDEYIKTDGWIEENGRTRIYKKSESMIGDLQEMLVIAGYGTTITKREDGRAHSVNVLQKDCASITTIEKEYYKGLVWCPTTNTGTFVARKNGKVFITGNTPFTNVTLAITCPDDLKGSAILVAGQPLENLGYLEAEGKTYGDMTVWQEMIVDALLDTFIKGDAKGNGFTFPILTINVTEDFFKMPIKDKIFELTAKFGTPYFQNFINGKSGGQKINPDDVRSLCCRLQISHREIQKHVGGLFGNADQTGSIQVVTISLPYIAMKTIKDGGNLDDFYESLEETMKLIRNEQLWKRSVVSSFFKKGLFPTAKENLRRGFDTFFTTIGFIGLWECVEILRNDKDSLLKDEGLKLGEEILEFMAETVNGFTEETGKLFNLEATPAESASYKLAKKAIKTFPDIPYRGKFASPYFTNSCHIPVEYQGDMAAVFRTQNVLQTIPSGGTVVHFYTGDAMNVKEVESAVRFICKNTQLPYFSLTTVYSMCPICGRISGAHEICPNKHTEEQIAKLKAEHPELVGD